MANPHGSFIWYELMTTDTAAATAFYTDVIGWTAGGFDGSTDVKDYTVLTAPDGLGVGGMMTSPEGGPPPGWFGYIGVDDVDAAVRQIENAGGAIHMPVTDIPGVGRLAMTADPQGAIFYVMRGSSPEDSQAFSPDAVGHCTWNELVAADQDAALAFYGDMFNWVKTGTMPMGPMGDYSFISHYDVPIGAMMNRQHPDAQPKFQYHFRVADLDASIEKVKAGGGSISHGPTDVPGGQRVAYARDPQGAEFGIVGK